MSVHQIPFTPMNIPLADVAHRVQRAFLRIAGETFPHAKCPLFLIAQA